MKVKQLMKMLRGLEEFELKDCGITGEILEALGEERQKGKWIEKEVIHFDDLEAKDIITEWQSCRCSECGRYDTRPYMYFFSEPNYCSYCGADMRGEKDE